MDRIELLKTRASGLDALDRSNVYRIAEIDKNIEFRNSDDGTFYKLLRNLPQGEEVSQPIYFQVEDDIKHPYTTIDHAAGYSATDTSVQVADAKLFVANQPFFIPRTLESGRVTAVNYSTNVLTLSRGTNAAALVDGDIVTAGPPLVSEEGSAVQTTTVVPGEPKFNYVTTGALTVPITKLQDSAIMISSEFGDVGTLPWAVAHRVLETRREINKALIFQEKGIESLSDGDLYKSQGFVHAIKSHRYDLSEAVLNYKDFSAMIDATFEDTASSQQKQIITGNWGYAAVRRLLRDAGVQGETYVHPEIGDQVLTFVTDGGNEVNVYRDRWGLSAAEGLAGWFLVVDFAHVRLREHKAFPWAWVPEVQDKKSMVREDLLTYSYSLDLRMESTHALIVGASRTVYGL